MSDTSNEHQGQVHILNSIKSTELSVSVVVMEKQFPISDLTSLNPGSILSFDVSADSPALLHVNSKPVAEGAVVQSNGNFGLRIDTLRN